MIDDLEAVTVRVTIDTLDEIEVDVVDRFAVAEAIDQIQRRAADAFDRRQVQFHRTGGHLHRLRAEIERSFESLMRVLDAKRHRAGRRAVLGRKVIRRTLRLAVDDEIDVTLAVQRDVLRAMIGDFGEPERFEYRLDRVGCWRCEFDEFETHESHRIFEEIGHGSFPVNESVCED